ncbi:MAG TPA: hypothetical protein VFV52_13085 [Bacilli bacterium]|nr:hypothetical protein [Bacilli bacterium]
MKKTLTYLLLALYAVFLAALYQVVAIPLALDFSLLGLALLFTAGMLGYLAIPKVNRRMFALLSLLVLIASYGVDYIYSDALGWRFLEFPLLFAVLGWLAYSYGKIRFAYTLTVVLVLGLTQAFVPLNDMAFTSNLHVVYKSDVLDEHSLFPLYTIAKGDKGTLYTLGDLREDQEDEELGKRDPIKDEDLLEQNPPTLIERRKQELEDMYVLSFDPENHYAKKTVAYEAAHSGQAIPFDLAYQGLPYSASDWSADGEGNLKQTIRPVDDPTAVLYNLMEPLTLPVVMSERTDIVYKTSKANYLDLLDEQATRFDSDRKHTPYETFIGYGRLLPGAGEQPVYEANNELRVYDAKAGRDGQPIATLAGTFEEPMTPDLLLADINGDDQDELLLNTVPAKILRLQQDGTWKTLWISGKDSFRFEFVEPRDGEQPLIVANAPSLLRDQPARYLTGFTWQEQGTELVRDWRVFEENIVHPFAIDQDLWVAQIYNNQMFYVLRPFPYPVETLLTALYLLLVLGGYGYRLTQGRRNRHA